MPLGQKCSFGAAVFPQSWNVTAAVYIHSQGIYWHVLGTRSHLQSMIGRLILLLMEGAFTPISFRYQIKSRFDIKLFCTLCGPCAPAPFTCEPVNEMLVWQYADFECFGVCIWHIENKNIHPRIYGNTPTCANIRENPHIYFLRISADCDHVQQCAS